MIKTAKTETGMVRGLPSADPRIISYKGIPFAAPPVGPLRWRAPQPAPCWEGVRDCYDFAPISMQPIPGLDPDNIYSREWHVDPDIPMSEDCLYLNIWTPARAAHDRLPVFVWYFGGGLQTGYTAEMEFDGERIARRGIVVVTINYRVNVFGFLAHPELTREAPGAPANFGHLDQQFGLKWVKRNISAFGGDPDAITIGGQSAGGGSVMVQLNCPANAPYIQRAIVESGILAGSYQLRHTPTLEEAEIQGKSFFELLGVKNLEEARALPAEVIRDKYEASREFFGTCIDHIFQTESYNDALEHGTLLNVPILLGHTDHEFFTAPPADSPEALQSFAANRFGDRREEFLELVHAAEGLDAALEKGTVNAMELAVLDACRMISRKAGRHPLYYYEFGPDMPGWDHPGAFHSSDLWFFFETLGKCWRPFTGKHYDLARQMCNYWCNFIRTGDPNGRDGDGSPMEHWLPYSEENRACMKFCERPELTKKPRAPLPELILETLPR